MSLYIVIRQGTTEVLGSSWSTHLEPMQKLAVKLGGIVTTSRFLASRGVNVVLEKLRNKESRPRKLFIGDGAAMIALTEEARAVFDGHDKSQRTVEGHMTPDGKRQLPRAAA